jgi:hypothetical protein
MQKLNSLTNDGENNYWSLPEFKNIYLYHFAFFGQRCWHHRRLPQRISNTLRSLLLAASLSFESETVLVINVLGEQYGIKESDSYF